MLKQDLIKENEELKALLKGWMNEVDEGGDREDWKSYIKSRTALGIVNEDLIGLLNDLKMVIADALDEVDGLGGMPVPWKVPVNAFSDYLDTTLGAVNSLLEDS